MQKAFVLFTQNKNKTLITMFWLFLESSDIFWQSRIIDEVTTE